MIVDRCDRSSFHMKSLTESTKNPTGVKDGSGCKVQQHYLHTIGFFLMLTTSMTISTPRLS